MKTQTNRRLNPLPAVLAALFTAASASASERYFAYSYEPETMPKGGWEYEQWVTLRAGRNSEVGQEHYQNWELRSAAEYGVTDNYTVELYLNGNIEHYRDPSDGSTPTFANFQGISLENRYQVLNPADHPVGLTLYVEPRFSGVQTELEEKVILGQRHGDWKWTLNLTHSTEWSDHFHSAEGEVELSCGLARDLSRHWALGLELRDHSDLPDYSQWENMALYVGPVSSYRRAGWWATLAVMPQIAGWNFNENADGNSHLELVDHERLNVRLLFGIEF